MKKAHTLFTKNLFTALMLIFATLAVHPQASRSYEELVAALRQAAAENDDMQRLALYDALVRNFGIAENPGKPTGEVMQEPSKWVFDQEIDPLTDKRRYFFMLPADSGANEYGKKPTLIVRSDGEDLELYINWNTYLGNDTDDYKYKKKYITSRVDSDKPTTALWNNSTDDKASFCPWGDVLALVRRMGEGTTFVARCTPYGASPITAVFDIRGLKALSMPYNDVLGWWK
jgi:hypothetical protein